MDDGFLASPYADEAAREDVAQFVAFLESVTQKRRLCRLLVSNDWVSYYDVSNGPLAWAPGNREVAELLPRLLSRSPHYEGRLGAGVCLCRRPNAKFCLILALDASEQREFNCEGVAVVGVRAGNETGYCAYWRTIMIETNLDAKEFDVLTDQAFWGIYVHPNARERWDELGFALSEIRDKLVDHLSYLSDCCALDVQHAAGNPKALEASAGSVGVEMSNEHLSKLPDKGRKLRTVTLEGTNYECLWHTKIRGDKGRIHFCVLPDTRVLIGVLHENLKNLGFG